MRCRTRTRTAGFSLIELLVVIAILSVIILISLPALDRMLQRGRIESSVRTTKSLMQVARLESIKRSLPTRVVADFDSDRILAYTDLNNSGAPFEEGTDRLLGSARLPRGVTFWGEEDGSPEGANALINFDANTCVGCPAGGWVQFNPDGSADLTGAIRFADPRGNYLEVAVTTVATGKVVIRKHDEDTDQYWPQGEVPRGTKAVTWEWH
jgi:prepilin-type N-terminal cleavage/methylation domain-containing protein